MSRLGGKPIRRLRNRSQSYPRQKGSALCSDCQASRVANLSRPLLFANSDKDPIFPIAGSREGFDRVRKVYETMGVTDRVQQEIFEGPHEFHGIKGLPFLAKSL